MRRTEALRTHGSASSPVRNSEGETAKKLPRIWPRATDSICARVVLPNAWVSSISVTGKSGERATSATPTIANTNTAMLPNAPAARLSRRGLSHMRPLQYLRAEVLVRKAHGARGHRYERMVGHPRRGVHFQQERPASLVEHQVD